MHKVGAFSISRHYETSRRIVDITDCSGAGEMCVDHCIIVHGTPGCSSSPAAGKKLHGDAERRRDGYGNCSYKIQCG